jgi:PAS domain S-box-containing protein
MQQLRDEDYRLIIDSVNDYAIFMLDPTGHIASWNRGAQRIKGWTADEIIGQHFSIFYPEEDVKRGKPEMELRVASKVGRFEDEDWRVRKDGTRFWANVIITAVRNKEGVLVGFAKVTRDLTERKMAEESLSAMKNDLEKTVGILKETVHNLNEEIVRRSLAEEELIKKNRELQVSNADLEQFAYVASHDLKEPLRTIGSYSTLLVRRCKGDNDPDIPVFKNFILDGVEHLQTLINGLLDYARIGKSDIRFVKVDTGKILEKVKMTLSIEIAATGAVVKSTKMPVVCGIPSLMSTLLQNLIGNALKFKKPGTEPRIEIAASEQEGEWVFSIKDNGIGIPKQYQEKIFKLFQRLHTREEYEGTGIGLALCRKIVEFHGGKLWLTSEPEKGSIFYFTVPKKNNSIIPKSENIEIPRPQRNFQKSAA